MAMETVPTKKLKNKEIRAKMIHMLIKATKRSRSECSKMVRGYLGWTCYSYDPNNNPGYIFDWEWDGYEEQKVFQGFADKNWDLVEVPGFFFDLREQYERNKR